MSLPLNALDELALDTMRAASREQLIAAVQAMPSYQRVALRWLARELLIAAADYLAPEIYAHGNITLRPELAVRADRHRAPPQSRAAR